MFDRDKTRDRVLSGGTTAQGVVVDNKPRYSVANTLLTEYKVTIRVRFEDGTTVEFAEELLAHQVGRHNEGAILPVRYDPDDHRRIYVDVPAVAGPPIDHEAEKRAAIARAERQLAGEPESTDSNPPATPNGPTEDEIDSARATLKAATSDKSAMAALKAARAAGNEVEVARLKAEVAAQNEKVQALNAAYQQLSAARTD